MPKNEQGITTCINHENQQMEEINQIASVHLQDKPGSATDNGGNLKLDVFICSICKYTEFYARPYNPQDIDIAAVEVRNEW